MNLEHCINWAIVNYPTLYRHKTHAESRLKVLDHYFLCIGTGMDWVKEGYLTEDPTANPENMTLETLPDNFYKMELYQVNIDPKKRKAIEKKLKALGSWYNIREGHFECSVTFESERKQAMEIVIKFEKDKSTREWSPNYIRIADCKDYRFSPYPICEYSPIVEMINKRTNSLHVENFDLTYVKEDWVQGAIDVAKATLEYYVDESRYSNNLYHPSQCLRQFQELYYQDPVKFVEARKGEGMTDETKIEDWCQICWDKHVKKQTGYCTKFLKMYDK